MDHGQFADLAAACHRALDPLHAMVYFAPETEEELTGIGLRRGRMSYFAGRAAAMGPVGAGTVTATFYNFNPQSVAEHIPHAWTLAAPEHVIEARYRAAGAAQRDRIEIATNNAASAPWIHLGADGANRLREICRRLSKRITAAGAFPAELLGGN